MDLKLKEFQARIRRLTEFDKMYEQARIVDPVNKDVLFIKNENQEEFIPVVESCFDVWGKGEFCKNCISMRAYNENETFIKMETSPDLIIMVTAIPIKIEERIVVVELLKNVTKSMVLGDIKFTEGVKIKKLLDEANLAAVTDELTQVYNKRFIVERLPIDLVTSFMEKQSLALLMVDIDHFKRINDTYGHLAGDYILKEFTRILGENTRQDKDWIARFGGEEFIVCLTNTDKESARTVAETMRKSIEENVFNYNKEKIKLTSSFGICALRCEEMTDYEALIQCADQKLYEAKKTGRNKICD